MIAFLHYLESAAIGVTCKLDTSIAVAIPGASLSITFFVASGVTSLLEKPVPPDVKMTFNFSRSLHFTKYSLELKISD